MSKATKYLMQRFKITEEEANKTIQELLDYEDLITEDSGELEQKAIESILGKSVDELQEM